MKKILKKILIYSSIIYLLFSLVFNIFLLGGLIEQKNGIEEQSQEYEFGQNFTFKDISLSNVNERIGLVNMNLISMGVSIIIGGIIGLIASVKENSKIKYIVYFIFGGIGYNILWTLIICIINSCYSLIDVYEFYNIISTFKYAFKTTFISYIFVYAIIIVGNIIGNTVKVNELNENLNNNEKVKEKKKIDPKIKKKIIKISIAILAVIIIVVAIVITRRTIILIKYSKVINEMNKWENYYQKQECEFNTVYEDGSGENKITTVTETYYKDGICLDKSENSITYSNKNEKEAFTIDKSKNRVILFERSNYNIRFRNYYYFDNYVRTWQNVFFAFKVSVKSEKYNNIDCYVITNGNAKLYLEKETFLPIRQYNISKSTILDSQTNTRKDALESSDTKYVYKINVVKDQDVAKPDITGYDIKRSNKDGKLENI